MLAWDPSGRLTVRGERGCLRWTGRKELGHAKSKVLGPGVGISRAVHRHVDHCPVSIWNVSWATRGCWGGRGEAATKPIANKYKPLYQSHSLKWQVLNDVSVCLRMRHNVLQASHAAICRWHYMTHPIARCSGRCRSLEIPTRTCLTYFSGT